MAANGVICALGIQFDLVPIRIADINGKAVVLLHATSLFSAYPLPLILLVTAVSLI